jgi:hypothetical protein
VVGSNTVVDVVLDGTVVVPATSTPAIVVVDVEADFLSLLPQATNVLSESTVRATIPIRRIRSSSRPRARAPRHQYDRCARNRTP